LFLSCSPQQFEQVKTLAEKLGLHRILAAMQILDHTHTRMLRSTQSRVLMELALIRIANLDHFHQVAVLLEQLRSGQTAALPAPTVKAVQRAIAPPQSQHRSLRESIGLADLNDVRASSVWHSAAESIDGMVGSIAMSCKSVRFEKTNIFVAVFDKKTSKDFCEKESARIRNALSQSVGKAVTIRLELDIPEESASAGTSVRPTDREQYSAAAENPLVLKIQETFGVTLHEVKR
jgi:DNA polymerase III gamma/tau subunit